MRTDRQPTNFQSACVTTVTKRELLSHGDRSRSRHYTLKSYRVRRDPQQCRRDLKRRLPNAHSTLSSVRLTEQRRQRQRQSSSTVEETRGVTNQAASNSTQANQHHTHSFLSPFLFQHSTLHITFSGSTTGAFSRFTNNNNTQNYFWSVYFQMGKLILCHFFQLFLFNQPLWPCGNFSDTSFIAE